MEKKKTDNSVISNEKEAQALLNLLHIAVCHAGLNNDSAENAVYFKNKILKFLESTKTSLKVAKNEI